MELSSDAAQDPAPVRPLILMTRKPGLDDSEATDALSPSAHDPRKAIAVSAAFPQRPTDRAAPDLCLLSADSVHFYVHRTVLAASNNTFDGILDGISPGLAEETPPVVPVEETSAVLNLVLHIVYCKFTTTTFLLSTTSLPRSTRSNSTASLSTPISCRPSNCAPSSCITRPCAPSRSTSLLHGMMYTPWPPVEHEAASSPVTGDTTFVILILLLCEPVSH